MFGWFKREKDDFILVKTLCIDGVKTATHEGTLYFYLYESRSGKRKVEHKITIPASNNFDAIAGYSRKIYPWLQGQDFDDIPSYWDLKKEKSKNDIKIMYKRLL